MRQYKNKDPIFFENNTQHFLMKKSLCHASGTYSLKQENTLHALQTFQYCILRLLPPGKIRALITTMTLTTLAIHMLVIKAYSTTIIMIITMVIVIDNHHYLHHQAHSP